METLSCGIFSGATITMRSSHDSVFHRAVAICRYACFALFDALAEDSADIPYAWIHRNMLAGREFEK